MPTSEAPAITSDALASRASTASSGRRLSFMVSPKHQDSSERANVLVEFFETALLEIGINDRARDTMKRVAINLVELNAGGQDDPTRLGFHRVPEFSHVADGLTRSGQHEITIGLRQCIEAAPGHQ